jgi:superkiller protein 3
LGRAFSHVGRLDDAEAARRRALQLFPNDGERYARLANLLAARGKWGEAAELMRNAFEIWFVAAKYHLRVGDYFSRRGDDDFAVNEYRLALRGQPDDREAGLRLAEALRRLGRRDEAVAAYRDALEAKGENARYYVEFGMLLLARGDIDDALAALSEAQRLAPEDLRARTCYAHGLCIQGKRTEGVAILKDILAKDPGFDLAAEYLAAAEAAGSGKEPKTLSASPAP